MQNEFLNYINENEKLKAFKIYALEEHPLTIHRAYTNANMKQKQKSMHLTFVYWKKISLTMSEIW